MTSINYKSDIDNWCIRMSGKGKNLPISAISAEDFAKLARKYKGKFNQEKLSISLPRQSAQYKN